MPFVPLEDDSVLGYMLESVLQGVRIENSDLFKSVSGYSASAYDVARHINDVAIEPVASTIIAIMLVLELARVSSRFEGDRELGIKLVAMTIFKSYILVMVASHSELIIDALNEVGDTIVRLIGNNVVHGSSGSYSSPLTAAMRESIDSMSYFTSALAVVMLFVPWLALSLVQVGVKIMIAFRFFELYVLSAFVTLPIVFASHPETKSITVGYLRRYGAVLIQAAVMIVSIALYSSFLSELGKVDAFQAEESIVSWLFANTLSFLTAPIFLGFTLFQSSRMAKAILGEG